MNHVRRIAVCAIGLLLAGLLSVITAPAASAVQGTVPGFAAPMWQTNGVVRAMAYANGTLYVGGEFTSVRPPGSSGANSQPRNYLAAFDASTGALITSFNPGPNGTVRALAVSPDGSRLYVGGQFTSIAGQSRGRIAAFSVANGALVGGFAPTFDGTISALAVGPDAVYAGGSFGVVNGAGRRWLGAVSPTNGARMTSFAPVTDNVIYGLDVSPTSGTLWVGGAFTQMNNDPSVHGAAALDPTSGANRPFAAQDVIPTPSGACSSVTKDVLVRGRSRRRPVARSPGHGPPAAHPEYGGGGAWSGRPRRAPACRLAGMVSGPAGPALRAGGVRPVGS